MGFKNRIISFLLAYVILLNSIIVVVADDLKDTEKDSIDSLVKIEDLEVQLDTLYKKIGENLSIDYMYVKMLHLIAGGKAVYADQVPNIYNEETVHILKGSFEIEGAKQSWGKRADFVVCADSSIERGNKYYLPDAAYGVTNDIIEIMNNRYVSDRGSLQVYFDGVRVDSKTTILFCEAVLDYVGERDVVDKFYPMYEKMMYEKRKNENILELDESGKFKFKDKYKDLLKANGFSERSIDVLSIILSFDRNLSVSDNPLDNRLEFVSPYKLDYTTRENMMLAAMSVAGKVRYVWGGGRLGTGNINGINPMWRVFNENYGKEAGEAGFRMSIRPDISWCPIHGRYEGADGCLHKAETVYSADEYLELRKEKLNIDGLGREYSDYLESNIDFSRGMNSHRLDGLDCSGYTSWVYNQITDKREYDAGAKYFISSGGLKEIGYGSEMLPGDVFSWGDHIVLIVGKVRDTGKSYIMLEASPNMVKFGVVYYGNQGVGSEELKEAIELAKWGNKVIAGFDVDRERTHIYNMDKVGFIELEIEGREDLVVDESVNQNEKVKKERYVGIGRLAYNFLDEDTMLEEYDKKFKDLNAKEIMEYTMKYLPYYYLGKGD